ARVGARASARAKYTSPLAEQPRQRSAKPFRRAQLPHGTPFPSGISVDRYTPAFQAEVEGALPSCPSIFNSSSERVCLFRDLHVSRIPARRLRPTEAGTRRSNASCPFSALISERANHRDRLR